MPAPADRAGGTDDDFTAYPKVIRNPALALLFLLLALPTVLIQVYLTPPMQVADEENHFLRSSQVAGRDLFARRQGGSDAGGLLDPAASTLAHAFDGLKFQPAAKLDPEVYRAASALNWGGPLASAGFANTAVYPFFLYLPGSAGIAAGKAAHLSVLDSFYLGRLFTALASVGLAVLAIAVCGRGRTLLFVILCCPMALSLFASVSQDAMSIALAALAAAIWSGYAARDTAMPFAARALVSLALGMVAAARLPLVPLGLLAFMPTRSAPCAERPWRIADLVAAAAGLVPLAAGLYGVQAAKVPFRTGDDVSPPEQLRWILFHPGGAVEVAARTLRENLTGYLREFVGVLGWLDVDLPEGFYFWMGLCFVLALLLDVVSADRSTASGWRLVPSAGALVCVIGVFGIFYLFWTPIGAPIVEGVQGRYFFAPILVLVVALPGYRGFSAPARLGAERLRYVLCGAVGLADLWVVPVSLLHRYHG